MMRFSRYLTKPSRWAIAGGLVAAVSALASPAAFASGAPLDVVGFENYTSGPLVPQLGWSYVNQLGTNQNVNGAVVQTAVRASGDKALKVDRVGGVDSWWGVNIGESLPTQRFMLVDWDMLVEQTGAENGGVGPFFGVESYGFDPNSGAYGVLGMFGADATTGEVVFLNDATSGIDNTGATFDFGAWNSYAILFDFQLHTYTPFFNGNRLNGSAFVDKAPGGAHFSELADAAIAAVAIAENVQSQAMPGTAYIDNFRILDGIPGDYQVDGDVDAGDLGFWKTAFHNTAVGDANGDGDSDGGDFLIWQQNLGIDLVPTVAAGAAVPEPTAMLLAVAVLGAIAGSLRRSPRRLRAISPAV
jgi:hypothetical protein